MVVTRFGTALSQARVGVIYMYLGSVKLRRDALRRSTLTAVLVALLLAASIAAYSSAQSAVEASKHWM
jgi:hypothetical protein